MILVSIYLSDTLHHVHHSLTRMARPRDDAVDAAVEEEPEEDEEARIAKILLDHENYAEELRYIQVRHAPPPPSPLNRNP